MTPQVLSSLRSTLLGLGGFIVGTGWVDASTMTSLIGVLMWALPAVWSLWAHRPAGEIAAAAAIPDVKGIVTTPAIANSPQFAADIKVVTSGAAVKL